MRKLTLATAVAVALVAVGAAVAHLRHADVRAASATFAATTPSNVQTRTLTCSGQTVEVTTGRWSGAAASSLAELNGPVELRVKSVYNTTTKLGWAEGKVVVTTAGNRVNARFTAVNVDGKLDGWVRGSAGRGKGTLLGSFTGTFSKTGGVTDGAFGTGTAANAAVVAKNVSCRTQTTPRPSVRLLVRGDVEAVSTSSISVKPRDGAAPVTCAVTNGAHVSRVKVGDRVEMTCGQVAGGWTLLKVQKR